MRVSGHNRAADSLSLVSLRQSCGIPESGPWILLASAMADAFTQAVRVAKILTGGCDWQLHLYSIGSLKGFLVVLVCAVSS